MSTPGGFEYTDDSVIARVAFDIPATAVNDISQITQVMGAMRTELESIARAQSDWLDYLQQVPQIAERANQVFREQITMMERMSYLQNEIGGIGVGGSGPFPGGGPGGFGGGAMAGGGGAGGYSTAAPPGYSNPFKDAVEGLGAGINYNVAAQKMAQAAEDPRAAGEFMAARGVAINPALTGTAAGAVTAMAKGKAEGNQAKSGRTADGEPDPTEGGAPEGSEPQDRGGGVTSTIAGGVMSGMISEGMGTRLGRMFGNVKGVLGGGGGVGSILSRGAGAAKNYYKSLSPAAKVAGGVGLGAVAFNKLQDVGEEITKFQQLGSEQGGDYATGIKTELEARFRALDPFINLGQAREAIQKPMVEGFKGESRDELRDLLTNNFKELGISFGTSMRMAMSDLKGVELTEENVKSARTSGEAFVNTLKELAGDGDVNSMAKDQRVAQAVQMKEMLASMGISADSAQRSIIGMQEGYGDSLALRDKIPQITGGVMSSPTLMAMVGQKTGVTGIVPEAMPAALEAAGFDSDEIVEMAAVEMAKMVSGEPNRLNRIGLFMRLMNDQGAQLEDFAAAEALYKKVTGDKKPTQKANERAAQMRDKNKQSNWNPITGIRDTLAPIFNARTVEDFKNIPQDVADGFMGMHDPSRNALRTADSFAEAGRIPQDNFAPAGRRSGPLPQTASQVRQQINTEGKVTGNVTITVDQQGRVTAPPTIQLTGTQKAVNAGAGSAQLNNAPPGDPSYNHSFNTFPGG